MLFVISGPKMLPTITFKDELDVILAGDLHLKLIHSPGETDDHIIIWMPSKKVLMTADNIYK